LTATSADGGCTKWWVVAVVGLGDVAEGVSEEVDSLALEAESDVDVDGCGDADVGVAQEFLDDDEFGALLQEQRRGRVAEVVKPDRPQVRLAEQRVEVAGSIGCPSGRVKT
jgi:hypothetical protein